MVSFRSVEGHQREEVEVSRGSESFNRKNEGVHRQDRCKLVALSFTITRTSVTLVLLSEHVEPSQLCRSL